MSVNKVFLVGNLARKPEVKTSKSGVAVCNFSMATTSSEKVNGEWQKVTEWHSVTCFGKPAEWMADGDKGSTVVVVGKIRSRKYTGKDGVEKTSYGIVADECQLVRNTTTQSAPRPAAAVKPSAPAADDGDIPF